MAVEGDTLRSQYFAGATGKSWENRSFGENEICFGSVNFRHAPHFFGKLPYRSDTYVFVLTGKILGWQMFIFICSIFIGI